MDTQASNDGRWIGTRKMHYPPLQTALAYALLYGVLLPIAKTLELFGQWPPMALLSGRQGRAPEPDFGDYEPTCHDVLACASFKSGTNWVMQIALQIAFKGRAEYDHIYDLIAWPDGRFARLAEEFAVPLDHPWPLKSSPTGLRIIKTHLPFSRVPFSRDAKYIAVVRDPKDVSVSAYYFLKALAGGPLMPSAARWTQISLLPGMPRGLRAWAEHLAGWWRVRNEPNVLFMTYEEMRRDSRAAVRKIADLMGVDLTTDEFEAVMEKSSFGYMKSIAPKFAWVKVLPWSKTEGAAIRTGHHGTSSEILTPELQARIDDFCRAELKRLGCDFPYDEAFGAAPAKAAQIDHVSSRDAVEARS